VGGPISYTGTRIRAVGRRTTPSRRSTDRRPAGCTSTCMQRSRRSPTVPDTSRSSSSSSAMPSADVTLNPNEIMIKLRRHLVGNVRYALYDAGRRCLVDLPSCSLPLSLSLSLSLCHQRSPKGGSMQVCIRSSGRR